MGHMEDALREVVKLLETSEESKSEEALQVAKKAILEIERRQALLREMIKYHDY